VRLEEDYFVINILREICDAVGSGQVIPLEDREDIISEGGKQ